ncbi:MAG: sulfatase-like hydrolase/transferase [Deltaproteobacteria bacterium]|nr:sulfatase-like hydrolase/transferase [Deltaproteobacteria bacterium]
MKKTLLAVTFLLSLVTSGLSIWSLQLAQPLFESAWLRPALFLDLWSKVGFSLMVFTFALSMVSVWMWLWTNILGLFGIHSLKRIIVASAAWLGLVAVDTFIRVRIAEVWGHQFSLEAAAASVESSGQMILSLWRWYRNDIVAVVVGCALLVALCAGACLLAGRLMKRTVRQSNQSRWFGAILAVSTIAAVLMVTVFLHRWPGAMTQITRTSVGYPFSRLVSVATDFDGDGWGYFDLPADTRPFDKRCRPFAIDIPDDGIDENLLGGDLHFNMFDALAEDSGIARVLYPEVSFERHPNVLVVLMESVRFDSLKKKIDGQAVTPSFRRMIANGALAPQHAFASQGYTISSVKQLAFGGFHTVGTTLFDDFRRNGYEIAVFSGYDLKEEKFDKFMQGDVVFDPSFDEARARGFNSTPARLLVDRIDRYLDERARSSEVQKPFFMFTFFVDPHFPYKQVNSPVFCERYIRTSEIRPENREAVVRSYFDQVHHVDTAAGRLMASLEAHGLADDTIVIFMSDHGESLYDDGNTIGHGIAINDVMTHLSMVIVHSPIDVPDVLSHHHVRGLLRQMLTEPAIPAPKVRPLPHRRLFQYIGSLVYPTRIGTYSVAEGRLIYDTQKNQITDARTNRSTWFTGDIRGVELKRRGQKLIQRWEYQLYLSGTVAPKAASKLARKEGASNQTTPM